MKTTGEQIREQREKHGLLLRQLASKLHVDSAILSKIERGERKATRDQMLKLIKILNLDHDKLLIQYLSEKIAYELLDEDHPIEVLKAAESKVNYYKLKKSNGTEKH